MSTFVVALLSFAAFSFGTALANLKRRVPPGPFASPAAWECAVVLLVVFAVAFARRAGSHGWRLSAGLLASAAVLGFLTRMLAIRTIPRSISSISGDFAVLDASQKQAAGWRRAWEAWKRFAHRVGDYQSHFFLTLFYLVILAPVAIWVSATKNPLRLRTRESGWLPRPQSDSSLHDARRQF